MVLTELICHCMEYNILLKLKLDELNLLPY